MMSLNNAYVEDLYFQYLRDPESVSQDWKEYFEQHRDEITSQLIEAGSPLLPDNANGTRVAPSTPVYGNGKAVAPEAPVITNGIGTQTPPVAEKPALDNVPVSPAKSSSSIPLGPNDVLVPLSGVAERIVANMEASLHVPTATSLRTLPIKVLDENRRIINHYLAKGRKGKVSFTHIIAWAITKSLMKYPQLNDTFTYADNKPHRVKRGSINVGLAVDTTRKDGSRSLVVPSIKDAQKLTFAQFVQEYDALINKARKNKLELADLMGTTVSLTNPGTIGTAASMPRLMEGQGLIIATGAIDYPSEFKAVSPEVLGTLAISKVMTLTSTYDHRIIQGAESGEFLSYMEELLLGKEQFYEQIFASFQIPFEPIHWSTDNGANPLFGIHNEEKSIEKEAKVIQLINAYRVRGHLYADINPLGHQAYYYPELEPSFYGFTLWDLDREFDTGGLGGVNRATLRDILVLLRETYCDKIGIEYMNIQAPEKKQWIRGKVEMTHNHRQYDATTKIKVFKKLVASETFERFLQKKFLGQKRFSLEGAESLIPMLDVILERGADYGLQEVFMGMAHRGRLNVLVNIIGKSPEKIFKEFRGDFNPLSFHGSGDVKYHLGAQGVYVSPAGKKVDVTLSPNPSHLEAVNPVVEGMARAQQEDMKEQAFSKVLPILIHGDAAFAGQGVVAETLNLANLRGYSTGGTIHIIINNQIGFTTSPEESRSTVYASDIAKMLQVPILHVNGGDPEAVLTAAVFAMEYRAAFNEDVVIDMLCYRKYGHNEADEPGYTQPLLYKKIRSLPLYSEIYSQWLIEESVLSREQADAIYKEANDLLETAFAIREEEGAAVLAESWRPADIFAPVHTAVSGDILKQVAEKITVVPPEFNIHSKLKDLLDKRAEMVLENKGVDWGMGEALAYGSLLMNGIPVRLSGQDSARGTFSQRHAVLVDQQTEREYIPLNALAQAGQTIFSVFDSSLSEYAVLGFEYGYSVVRRDGLTLWEAQFGDFINGAQIMIDQFLSSAELKWGQTSSLVLLLPHGYEGQGPEHSSARYERFLVLCAENNMIVCNLSTSAQYFHALRRQVLRDFRKPLIVMTPKSLLRQPSSTLEEFTDGGFQEVIDDATITKPGDVHRVLLCSGKIYYELDERRKKLNIQDVAIIRIEQIYPFYEQRVKELFEKYGNAREVVWVQEEPKNMGAWSFLQPRILELLPISRNLTYVGRKESASTATGYQQVHAAEQEAILSTAFSRF